MKKYISLLSIATALMMQSCDRSDINNEEEKRVNHNLIIQNRTNSVKNIPNNGSSSSNNFEPGGDDEPERDKQHWRSNHNGH